MSYKGILVDTLVKVLSREILSTGLDNKSYNQAQLSKDSSRRDKELQNKTPRYDDIPLFLSNWIYTLRDWCALL